MYQISKLEIYKEDIPSKCLLGNDSLFNSWWLENSKKKIGEESDMSCFESTDSSKSCDSIISSIDKAIDILQKGL